MGNKLEYALGELIFLLLWWTPFVDAMGFLVRLNRPQSIATFGEKLIGVTLLAALVAGNIFFPAGVGTLILTIYCGMFYLAFGMLARKRLLKAIEVEYL